MFTDTVVNDSDGIAMRQIPSKTSRWASSTWISQCELVRHRHYCIFNHSWSWCPSSPIHVDDNGTRFIYFENTKLKVTTAVALAWVPQRHPTRTVTTSLDSDSDSDVILDDQREEWRKLVCPSNICLPAEDYRISSLGRVQNETGQIASGTYLGDTRVICLQNGQTIRLHDSVCASFNTQLPDVVMKPRIHKLLHFMRRGGRDLRAYAKENGLRMSTMWSYLYDVFVLLDIEECMTLARPIISSKSWEVMHTIFELQLESIFLTRSYMQAIDDIIPNCADWHTNTDRFGEIRILKLICEKETRQMGASPL